MSPLGAKIIPDSMGASEARPRVISTGSREEEEEEEEEEERLYLHLEKEEEEERV